MPTSWDLCQVLLLIKKGRRVFVCQSQLLSKDLQLLQTELMEASLSDTSGLNFFEDFHISPLKVRRPEIHSLV